MILYDFRSSSWVRGPEHWYVLVFLAEEKELNAHGLEKKSVPLKGKDRHYRVTIKANLIPGIRQIDGTPLEREGWRERLWTG